MRLQLRTRIRGIFVDMRREYLKCVMRMNISKSARISWHIFYDKTTPRWIYIDYESYFASRVIVFTHDYAWLKGGLNIKIGKRYVIGVNAIIMPGITIGDSSIVGASSVLKMDVSGNCLVAWNLVKTGIKTGRYGYLIYENNK